MAVVFLTLRARGARGSGAFGLAGAERGLQDCGAGRRREGRGKTPRRAEGGGWMRGGGRMLGFFLALRARGAGEEVRGER